MPPPLPSEIDAPAVTPAPPPGAPRPISEIEAQVRASQPQPPPPPRRQRGPLKAILITLTVLLVAGWFFGWAGRWIYERFITANAVAPVVTPSGQLVEDNAEVRPVIEPGRGNARASSSSAPGEAVAGMSTTDASGASPGFAAFVDGAVISGVFQGEPARVFINGRIVRAGEVADEHLGIRFVGLDRARDRLIFRDAAGTELTREF